MKQLSPRQLELVILLANGYNMKEAALVLANGRTGGEGIGIRTVNKHMREARRRMQARTTEHLIAIVYATGLIVLDDTRLMKE